MKQVTVSEFIGVVSLLPGAQPATLTTYTDARLRKTGNPFGAVRKLSRVNVMVGSDYELESTASKFGKARNRVPSSPPLAHGASMTG